MSIKARAGAIWICGLLASGILGGMIGAAFDSAEGNRIGGAQGFFGLFAGMLAFACARLWLGAPKR